MKPFDLEAAKRGEPICTDFLTIGQLFYVGVRRNGLIVAETKSGCTYTFRTEQLQMAPKKRTVWVNLNRNGHWYRYDTKEEADNALSRGRLSGKAYRLEIEE